MPEQDKTAEIEAGLALLRHNFAKKIPGKVQEIRQSWDTLKLNPQNSDMYQQLYRQSHSLSGTAATFGFQDIGNLCKTIELALQSELPPDKKHWPEESRDKIAALLLELESLVTSDA